MSEAAASSEVRLVGLPLLIRRRYLAYAADLLRELTLVQIGSQQHLAPPGRLAELAAAMATTDTALMAAPTAAMAAAEAAGELTCDVRYVIPAGARPFIAELGARLAEAEEYCRGGGHLLTLPPPVELSAYREWIFGELLAQLDGEPPRPWVSSPGDQDPPGVGGRHWDSGVPAPSRSAVSPAPRLTGGDGGLSHAAGASSSLRLEPTPAAARQARGYVVRALAALGASLPVQDDAALATSELVTNAVLHARTPIDVAVAAVGAETVRVTVSDASHLPIAMPQRSTAATGRGLHLVQSVTSAFGIDQLGGAQAPGKRVWFEVSEPTSPAALSDIAPTPTSERESA